MVLKLQLLTFLDEYYLSRLSLGDETENYAKMLKDMK